MSQQKPPRVSFYADDETVQALSEIKAHYGTSSNPVATRRAIVEHAKALREPPRRARVTLSERVH